MDKSFWRRCGEQGLLCPDMPEAYGGSGQDFRYNAIVLEETSFTGSSSPTFGVHSDIVAHYTLKYASEPVRRHWLPRMVSVLAPHSTAAIRPRASPSQRWPWPGAARLASPSAKAISRTVEGLHRGGNDKP